MFDMCRTWENYDFPKNESSFYDDNDVRWLDKQNYCQYQEHAQQEQPHKQAIKFNQTQFYSNTSPSNDYSINSNTELIERNPVYMNVVHENNNIKRHYPYEREAFTNDVSAQYQSCLSYTPNAYQHNQQKSPHLLQQEQHQQQIPTVFNHGLSTKHVSSGILPTPQQHYYISNVPNVVTMPRVMTASAPCRGNQPWTYAYCYGYAPNNQEPCQFTQFVDIEDFMNNEKRKEKSRDAARCRRSRETEIFSELAEVLPLKKDDVNQLDKASIMRIAIAYLKIRDMLHLFPKIQAHVAPPNADDEADNVIKTDTKETLQMLESEKLDLLKYPESSQLLKETLDGFLLVLSNDGDIIYVSENICEYLGISKIDILGQPIWEYVHQCDHAELKEALNIKRNSADKIKDENMQDKGLITYHRDLFVRFKCTLTSRGRSINIKSASYKVIHLSGHLVTSSKGDEVIVAIGCPIPHPSNIEIPLGTTTFLTKHSLDMKFTYVDEKMYDLLDYKPDDLLQKSLYDYHHVGDSERLLKTFKSVLTKGQCETSRYRFLGKYGGYCWLVTQATIVYDKLKPQSVVCVNYVVSRLENNHEIYSLLQCEETNKQKIDEKQCNTINNSNCNNDAIKEIVEQTNEINQEAELKQTFNTLNISNQNNKNNSNNNNNNIESNIDSNIKNDSNANQNSNQNKTSEITTSELSSKFSDAVVFIKSEPIATTKIVYKPINTNLQTQLPHQQQQGQQQVALSNQSKPKVVEEKRPKSVTASVFRVAPIHFIQQQPQQQHQSLLTNTNNNIKAINSKTTTARILTNALPSAAIPPPRAQSVTASVLTPITQLSNKNLTNINRPITTTTTTAAILAQQQNRQQQPQAMNKGFLSFAEDATELTMLKEEPDDLSHMTSTAVDTCLPLDETAPLFGEMFVGLMGTYGSLLADDINSLDSTSSSTDATTTHQHNRNNANIMNNNTNNYSNLNSLTNSNTNSNSNNTSGSIDPFNIYREESNDTNCSQHLLSPSVTSKSPEASSLPSLCSPHSLSQEDDFALMTINELSMRAPYIPMDEQDDLPLLTDDLMWCSSSAFTTEELNLHKDADTLQQLSMHHHQQHQQQQQLQQQQQHHNQHQTYYTTQHEQHFSNSLCSSPASTISSLSPASPLQQTQQQQQMNSHVFCTDSSELAALLGGTGNGTLSILNNNNTNDNTGNCNINNYDGNNLVDGIVNNIGDVTQQNLQQQRAEEQHQQQQQKESCSTTLVNRLQQLHQEEQEQQHQNELIGLSIDCKKEKFVDSPITTSLCDSIEDAFDNVYNKDSTNGYCWSEFLQINVPDQNTTTNSAGTTQMDDDCKQELQIEQLLTAQTQTSQSQQQNIIINAVPLITIQNANKNILLQQQSGNTKMLLTDDIILSTNDLLKCSNNSTNNNNNNHNNSSNNASNKISTIKLINGTTAAITPITTKATIRLIENKMAIQQQQQLAQTNKTQSLMQTPQQHANKRHLSSLTTATTQVESKRLKSNDIKSTTTVTATPQLLQQLINGNKDLYELQQHQQQAQQTHSQQLLQNKQRKASAHFTINSTNHQQTTPTPQQQQQQQQQSNSVLKNLLISGCDPSNSEQQEDEPMLIDENSIEPILFPITIPTPLPLSPPTCVTASLMKPINCLTDATTSAAATAAAASMLRNTHHNPMIGGPGVLLSPTFINLNNDDSNTSDLAASDIADSASISGIDEISLTETMSPMKQYGNETEQVATTLKRLSNAKTIKHAAAVPQVPPIPVTTVPPPTASSSPLPPQAPLTTTTAAAAATKMNKTLTETGKTMRKSSISFMDSSNPFSTPLLMELCNDDYNMSTRLLLEGNDLEQVLGPWSSEIA